MIQQKTILKVVDNSGAKTVRCIKVLGGFKKKYAFVGDILIVSIQKLRNKYKKSSKVLKGEILKALVIRTKTLFSKTSLFSLCENSVILINKQGNPLGTRVIGPLTKTFMKKKFSKFIVLSAGLI